MKRRQKNENGNGNLIKNPSPDEDLALKTGELWADTFSKKLPKERPSWDGKINKCARWHIKGDCYDDCSRKESHVGKDKIPADKKSKFPDLHVEVPRSGKRKLTPCVRA